VSLRNADETNHEFIIDETNNIKFEILYNEHCEYDYTRAEETKKFKAHSENDYSVCSLFSFGEKTFLFTGDLESGFNDQGAERSLVENNLSLQQIRDNGNKYGVELYKAGHHGSKSSSTTKLLKEIQPKIVVISCAIGDSYDFPRQEPINRIAEYTDKVYVTTMANEKYTNGLDYTAMNGNVVVYSKDEGVSVKCSANDTLLKDTDWFRENRTLPSKWVA
jgi:hypothetical protein